MNELAHKIAVAIDDLGSDHNMRRDRPFNGQPHTCSRVMSMDEAMNETKPDGAASAVEHHVGRLLPCPNRCPENLYHSGWYVVCQICGLRGPEQDGGSARQATDRWNALPRSNANVTGAREDVESE